MSREAYYEALSDAIESIHRLKRTDERVHLYDEALSQMERELDWETIRQEYVRNQLPELARIIQEGR